MSNNNNYGLFGRPYSNTLPFSPSNSQQNHAASSSSISAVDSANPLSPMNSMDPSNQSSMNTSTQSSPKSQPLPPPPQPMPMGFNSAESMNPSMCDAPMLDYTAAGQSNDGFENFTFDPSLTGYDPSMATDMQSQLNNQMAEAMNRQLVNQMNEQFSNQMNNQMNQMHQMGDQMNRLGTDQMGNPMDPSMPNPMIKSASSNPNLSVNMDYQNSMQFGMQPDQSYPHTNPLDMDMSSQ